MGNNLRARWQLRLFQRREGHISPYILLDEWFPPHLDRVE